VCHTAELLVPKPSTFEVEWAIKKLKSHKSPGIDQIPAELIKEGGRTICYLRERADWRDQDVDGRIILKWIFRKWEGVLGNGWSWLRIGTDGVHW
jgi:hypothetical protein